MIATAKDTGAESPRISARDIPVDGIPRFRDERKLLEYLDVKKGSLNDRELLLRSLREKNPEINGNAEKALEQILLNHEQIQKKESFLKKTLKFPFRHPYITTAAVVSALAVLYSTGVGTAALTALQGYLASLPDGALRRFVEKIPALGRAAGSAAGGASPDLGIPPDFPVG